NDALADLRRVEAAFLHLDVPALLVGDLADDRGIGAWPANALLFQRLDQRRLVVARRRLGEVLAGDQVETVELLLYRQRRQQGVLLLARRSQHTAEAVELQDLALGLEQTLGRRPRARAWGLLWGGGGHLDVGHGEDRRRHLA